MFLLIDKTPHMARCVQSISIHLMFLLIPAQRREVRAVKDFNTSHVSINHCSYQTGCDENLISIHLMFLLIGSTGKAFWKRRRISIHLMFLLILMQDSITMMILYFNTSHVSINHYLNLLCKMKRWYFNISHVSINHPHVLSGVHLETFQYISCFY